MSEHVFNCLGLKISAPAPYKAKMANNVKVKCLGIVNGVRVKVCEVDIEVDVSVMSTMREGYPIVLGRSWLMTMQARQDWGTGMLELSPHEGSGKKTKVVHYAMKTGKQGKMKFETSADEFSSSTYSTTTKEESITSDESDSLGEEVMGLILTKPNKVYPPDMPRVEESKLAKMLARNLTEGEKQAYSTMLEDFPSATDDTPMLVNSLVTRLQQAMDNPALQDKVSVFIQQFDVAFGDEGFTNSSKLQHIALHFQKSIKQWWDSLQANGKAPKTWKAIRASIMKHSLPTTPKLDFEEQKQQFCAWLPKDMNEYVYSQRSKSILAVIHPNMVAARINFQQGTKRNRKRMEMKDKPEYKGKNYSQNFSKGSSSNNKAKEKGVYKGKNRPLESAIVPYVGPKEQLLDMPPE
ncbi:hypothetical protein L7F22_066847 [Adiantum nelumboides]|nr:hypothetical protein [Adiantum nelumboides]